MTTFGERIRIVREALGLDQKAFGKAIGVAGRDTISRWERGLGFPAADILMVMRQKYGVNQGWLLGGEGEPFIGTRVSAEASVYPVILPPTNPVLDLFVAEEEQAGLSLTPEQRTAILKIFRELVERDVRFLRELFQAFRGGEQPDEE